MSLRVGGIATVLTLLMAGGWLFAQSAPQSNYAVEINGLLKTLQQVREEVKRLQLSVKEASRSKKPTETKKDAVPATTAVLPPAASPSPLTTWQKAQQAYGRGRELEALKLWPPAVEAYSEAIHLDPNNDAALLRRGYCYRQMAEDSNAISDLTKSLQLQPNNSFAYTTRAAALASVGRVGEALSDINESLGRNGNDPLSHFVRGELYRQRGEPQKAIDDYTLALSVDPNFERAFLARAGALRDSGKMELSTADCDRAIQLSPNSASGYVCRAESLLKAGALQLGIQDINRALLVSPGAADAPGLLRQALEVAQAPQPPQPATRQASNQAPQAVPVEPEAPVQRPLIAETPAVTPPPMISTPVPQRPATLPSAAILDKQARSLTANGHFEQAIQVSSRAIEVNPALATAYNTRGYAYLRTHQFKQAIEDFSAAIRVNPKYVNAYHNRSVARTKLRQSAEAAADSRKAAELAQVRVGRSRSTFLH